MARPRKEKPAEEIKSNNILAEKDAEFAAAERLVNIVVTDEQIKEATKKFRKDWITPEQFLISKGIDPPIKYSPVQNVTFYDLIELLNEFKNV